MDASFLEVDVAAIRRNYRRLRDLVGPQARICPVIKGNAYGMANTLTQTAFLRPKIKSKKVKDLYFTGQLTVPGPGVPPALISGNIVADMIAPL